LRWEEGKDGGMGRRMWGRVMDMRTGGSCAEEGRAAWGREGAQQRDKATLPALSCHFPAFRCLVVKAELFESEETATLMNKHLINIKVHVQD
jgi:hypothetical protein